MTDQQKQTHLPPLGHRVDGSPLHVTGWRRFLGQDSLRVAEITALFETLTRGLEHGGYKGPGQIIAAMGTSFLFYGLMAKLTEVGVEGRTPDVEGLGVLPSQPTPSPKRILTCEENAAHKRWSGLFSTYAAIGVFVGIAGVVMNFSPADAFVFYGLNAYLCHRKVKNLEAGKITVKKVNSLGR